jgi:hypothetical protein
MMELTILTFLTRRRYRHFETDNFDFDVSRHAETDDFDQDTFQTC